MALWRQIAQRVSIGGDEQIKQTYTSLFFSMLGGICSADIHEFRWGARIIAIQCGLCWCALPWFEVAFWPLQLQVPRAFSHDCIPSTPYNPRPPTHPPPYLHHTYTYLSFTLSQHTTAKDVIRRRTPDAGGRRLRRRRAPVLPRPVLPQKARPPYPQTIPQEGPSRLSLRRLPNRSVRSTPPSPLPPPPQLTPQQQRRRRAFRRGLLRLICGRPYGPQRLRLGRRRRR